MNKPEQTTGFYQLQRGTGGWQKEVSAAERGRFEGGCRASRGKRKSSVLLVIEVGCQIAASQWA